VYLKDIRYSLFAVFLQMIASVISAPIVIRYNPNSSRTIVAAAHSTGPPMLAEVENPNRLIEKRNTDAAAFCAFINLIVWIWSSSIFWEDLDFNFSLIIVCFGIPNSGVNLKIKFDERHGVHRINFKTIRINIWKFILKIIVYANFIIFKY
jgi:hypothetical protein